MFRLLDYCCRSIRLYAKKLSNYDDLSFVVSKYEFVYCEHQGTQILKQNLCLSFCIYLTVRRKNEGFISNNWGVTWNRCRIMFLRTKCEVCASMDRGRKGPLVYLTRLT